MRSKPGGDDNIETKMTDESREASMLSNLLKRP